MKRGLLRFVPCAALFVAVVFANPFSLSDRRLEAEDAPSSVDSSSVAAPSVPAAKEDFTTIEGSPPGHGPEEEITRLAAFDRAASIADSARTDSALSFIEQILTGSPGSMELAWLQFELSRESCDPEAAAEFIGSEVKLGEATDMFFLGEISLSKRDFAKAAEKLGSAAGKFLQARDTLSAVFSILPLVSCELSLARFDEAAKDVDRLKMFVAVVAARCALGGSASATGGRESGILRLELECNLAEAECLNSCDRLEEADSLYRFVMEECAANGMNALRLRGLLGYGRLLEKRELLDRARSVYEEAASIAEGLHFSLSMTAAMNNLGQVEIGMANGAEGRRHLLAAKSHAESCGMKWLEGNIFYGLGSSYEAEGDRNEAMKYFLLSESAHRAQGNLWGELGASLRVAYILFEDADYEKALERYGYCIAKYEEIGSDYGLGWAVGGRAICEHNMGMLSAAERDYDRCLRIRRRLGDRRGAVWAISSLGMVYDIEGAYGKSLACYFEALKIAEDLGDWRGAGKAYFGVGSAYYYLGALNKSKENYERAFELAVRVNDRELQYRAASGLGSVYSKTGRFGTAEGYYLMCLRLSRDLSSPVGVAWANMNLASLYVEMGHISEAREYLASSRDIARKYRCRHIEARLAYLASKIEVNEAKKMTCLDEALKIAGEVSVPEIQWRALSDIGAIYHSRGDVAEALAYQERAMSIVEGMVDGMGMIELKSELMASSLLAFDRAIRYALESTGPRASGKDDAAIAKAFSYLERKRRLSIELLVSASRGEVSQSTTHAERNTRGRELRGRISLLQSRLQSPFLSPAEWEGTNEEIARLERELEMLRLSAKVRAKGIDRANVFDPDAARSKLSPGEVVLSYFLSDGFSCLFLLDREGLELFRLKDGRMIEKKIDRFLEIFDSGFSLPAPAESSDGRMPRRDVPSAVGTSEGGAFSSKIFEAAASSLYDELIGAASDSISPHAHLIIIPDKRLSDVPFSILMKNGKCLVREHAIYFVPSVQSLLILREREEERVAEANGRKDMLDMAAFGCVGTNQRELDRAERFFPFTAAPVERLRNADIEARNVAGIFARSLALTGSEATETAFKRFPLTKARILHMASHCYVSEDDVRRSFIVMNRDTTTNGPDDGIVQWGEILELDVRSDLVVLSGCRSAKGAVSNGMGIEGLGNAFIYAGSNCVLASLFDVPDVEASRFMDLFYRQVAKGVGFADALRFAQLKAAASSGAISRPSVWGGFVLIGEAGVNPMLTGVSRTGGHSTGSVRDAFYVFILFAASLFLFLMIRYDRT